MAAIAAGGHMRISAEIRPGRSYRVLFCRAQFALRARPPATLTGRCLLALLPDEREQYRELAKELNRGQPGMHAREASASPGDAA